MYRRFSFLTILLLLLIAVGGVAEIPGSMNYQGYLTDAIGDPVSDGAYLVKFTIYDAAVGGTDLWNSGFQNVTTTDGLFTYELGSNIPLPNGIFEDTNRYIGITVGVDPELAPRSRLISAPYAFHASRADTAAFTESATGVTQQFDDGDVVVTGFLNYIGVDSINCPAEGYVMVNLTTTLNCSHTSGDEDVLFVTITDSTSTATSDQDNSAWAVNSAQPNGLYGTIVHKHKVFPVSAGWNRFESFSFHNPGGGTDNCATADVVLSLLFIPQSLGTVSVSSESISQKFKNVQIKR
ncbi:MAG: hypothetical protein DWP97_05055 [Calditrichaeota bacterium]|nr:MAG: hypothetical protein DWP97_05055 [Calditrichota bacterium]